MSLSTVSPSYCLQMCFKSTTFVSVYVTLGLMILPLFSFIPHNTPKAKNISIGFGAKLSVCNKLIVKNDNEFSDLNHLCDMIYRLSLQSPTEYATISSISTAIVSILNKKEDDCDFIERLISTIINRFCDVDFNLIKEMSDTGYATDYVRTLFKKKFGVTPLKYLTELRLKYTDNLLKISNTKWKKYVILKKYFKEFYVRIKKCFI